ncbi:hypothetical protein Xen7305DRAFT_00031320 [Xenococcus sp. PCC 7305]|uniref:RuBisCO accumulation factor 1 n=1 Tax=Xenococcus sp. PCC 7305 TaxID=102125 RepID=UPI0002AC633B|nr:RuBisCO accumulation factor 1 [Xenococcus sp. PCC 7305]ELS03408.1 hypothetical protein Xen7305DRAFT_00031320 [Xenococcus sp. PCC 7305]
MESKSQNSQLQLSEAEIQEKLRSLLHKEGTWVDWGKTCQQLHKAGCSPEQIFETSGLQESQQNVIVVASQVYESLEKEGVAESVLNYFRGPRSDVLYEFRILKHKQRAAAAELACAKNFDVDDAHELIKAARDVGRISQLPDAFTSHPGDMVAYLCWKRARGKKDLQTRSRLIAQGLKFAVSNSAREAIEKLLSDFSVATTYTAPLLPVYRLEFEEELPRIIPVAGTYPLTRQDIAAVSPLEIKEPFRTITISHNGTFVPVPGWQAILKAKDPVGYFCQSELLPNYQLGKAETVLVIIDRAAVEWNVNSYFLVETEKDIVVQWSEEAPSSIIGQLLLIMRAKNIIDEGNITEPWQMDD